MTPVGAVWLDMVTRMSLRQVTLWLAAAAALVAPLFAQPRPAVTAADYARAEKFLAANLNGLVVGGIGRRRTGCLTNASGTATDARRH